jgi:hypothetical protein
VRTTTPASRAACARHAAGQILAWDYPENAGNDWNPSPAQVIERTKTLYSWVEISEDEALTAIAEVSPRRITASYATTPLPGFGQSALGYPAI